MAPVVASGELGLLTVELLAAARASSLAGAPISLELDETLVPATIPEGIRDANRIHRDDPGRRAG